MATGEHLSFNEARRRVDADPDDIDALRALLEHLHGAHLTESGRLKKFRRYRDGVHDKPQFSEEAEQKFGKLWRESTVNYMGLFVNTIAQRLVVQGYRDANGDTSVDGPWRHWQDSRCDASQNALYRDVATYGYAYGSALPAQGSSPVRLRFWSPRTLYCWHENADDEYATYAVRFKKTFDRNDVQPASVWLWTRTNDYEFARDSTSSQWQMVSRTPHTRGWAPFVRYDYEIELDDVDGEDMACESRGVIEPLLRVQNQLNRVSFIINLIAEKTSFDIKLLMGVDLKKDENGEPIVPWKAHPGEIWTLGAGPDGQPPKAQQFMPSSPEALVNYRDKLRQDLFNMAQIPPTYGNGEVANVSAEGIAELQAMFEQMLVDLRDTLGETHESLLRIASLMAGDLEAAEDTQSQIWWRDTSPKSLGMVMDAIGKGVAAEIPIEFLVEWLPNMSGQDLRRLRALIKKQQAQAVAQALMGGANGQNGNPEQGQASQGSADQASSSSNSGSGGGSSDTRS